MNMKADGLSYAKTLAGSAELRLSDVLVLGRGNDPYSIGTPSHYRDGEWFAEQFKSGGFAYGVHLRGIHYYIASVHAVKPNGDVYRNTLEDWGWLGQASKVARLLGLVPASSFSDKRNNAPVIHRFSPHEEEDDHLLERPGIWSAGSFIPSLRAPYLDLYPPELQGYEYSGCDQPYNVEIWIEKSTMDHVLLPICRQYGITLVTSVGFQSITSAIGLLNRTREKPTHVLYIADFDPAGVKMPQSVARQVQFQTEMNHRGDNRLTIEHLMLKPDMVKQFDLPPIPIKESDLRRRNFEALHGEGAVELDALEALHPGVFGDTVRQAVHRFRDQNLKTKTQMVASEADTALREKWSTETAEYRERAADIQSRIQVVYDEYQPELEVIAERMETDLESVNQELEGLREEYCGYVDQFAIELPPRPEPEIDGPCDDPLYDSERDHVDQLLAFQRHEELV